MPLWVTFRLALRELQRNRLESALTMLGVIIGVAALLTTVALGTGARTAIEHGIRAAGTNVITIRAGNYDFVGDFSVGVPQMGEPMEPDELQELPPDSMNPGARFERGPADGPGGVRVVLTAAYAPQQPYWPAPRTGPILPGLGAATTLSPEDAEAIREIDGVDYVSPGVSGSAALVANDRRHFARMEGSGVELPLIRTWLMQFGRFFDQAAVDNAAHEVVLGAAVSAFLFDPGVNPVGQDILVGRIPFTVVGVISPRARGVDTNSPADAIFIPYTTAQQLIGIPHLQTILVAAETVGDTTRVSGEVSKLLRERHDLGPDDPDDFMVQTQARGAVMGKGLAPELRRTIVGNVPSYEALVMRELGLTLQEASRTMMLLLIGIASVSLIVGGVGIMNIMLVAVTERTREIGIRMAVGARGRDVLVQFLLEAMTLSGSGGVLGILVGAGAAAAITHFLSWSTVISPATMLFTFGIALAIGVFFGFYPASQAARLQPMDALRYE